MTLMLHQDLIDIGRRTCGQVVCPEAPVDEARELPCWKAPVQNGCPSTRCYEAAGFCDQISVPHQEWTHLRSTAKPAFSPTGTLASLPSTACAQVSI